MNLKALSFVSLMAFVVSCGGTDKEETGTTSDDTSDTSDATDDTGDGTEQSTDATDVDTTDVDTTDVDTTDTPDPVSPGSGELPEPVLPDVPPETPLSELDDDQLQEVCEAYVETAEVMVSRLPDVCNIRGAGAGIAAETMDEATLRAACEVGHDACVSAASDAEDTVASLSCGPAGDCDATLEQFNDCNRQIAAANELLLTPLIELDAPECSELTVAEAAALEGQVNLVLITGAISVGVAAGGLPSDADGPCGELERQCPDFAAPYTSLSALFTL